MAIIYPDIEPLLVEHIRTKLADIPSELTDGVRVATKKSPPGSPQPAKQVVLIGQYNTELDVVRKAATCTIDVWADDYQTASDLALLVAAIVTTIPGDPIKRCVVTLGPIRVDEESEQEHRAMTVELVVKGSHL